MASPCESFSDPLLRAIAEKAGISSFKKDKNTLCQELIAAGRLPVIPALQPECDKKTLNRLKYQAKLLGIPKPDAYNQKTKQLLCDEIQSKIQAGNQDLFEGIQELEKEDCMIDGRRYTTTELRAKADQYGLSGVGDLDKSAMCFLIKKELTRLQDGGAPKISIRRQAPAPVLNTYDQFRINSELEASLTVAGQSLAICSKRLRAAQIVPADYLSDPRHFGMTLFHEVGTGKTFSAINTSQILLRRGIIENVIIITPLSLQYNFKDQFTVFNKDLATDPSYQYYTPQRFLNLMIADQIQCLPKTLLIIDEAHNYRTSIWSDTKAKKEDALSKKIIIVEDELAESDQQGNELEAERMGREENKEEHKEEYEPGGSISYDTLKGPVSGKQVRAIYRLLRKCKNTINKVLLLTATPFVNSIYDIENLRCFMTNRKPREPIAIKTMDDYPEKECLFHVYRTDEQYKRFYPSVRYHSMYYRMSDLYYESYYKIQKNQLELQGGEEVLYKPGSLSNFFNGVRRASNVGPDKEHSDKLTAVIDMVTKDVRESPNTRILVYSSWLETGLVALQRAFSENEIRAGPITGKLSKISRKQLVDEYNDPNSNLNVLLISKAGGEGLDLKRTRKVYILEPTWNDASIQQIIGRAVRYQSHADLPEAERFVDIYRLFLLKPFEAEMLARNEERTVKMLEDPGILGKYPLPFFAGVAPVQIAYTNAEGNDVREDDVVMSIDLYLHKFLKKKQSRLDVYIEQLEIRSETCYDDVEERILQEQAEFLVTHPDPIGKHISRKMVIEKEDEISPADRVRQIRQEIKVMVGINSDDYILEVSDLKKRPEYNKDLTVRTVADIAKIIDKFGDNIRGLKQTKKVQLVVCYRVPNHLEEKNIAITIYYVDSERKLIGDTIFL
jgi:hypothetical protein